MTSFDEEELQHWHTDLEQADEKGVFFASFTMMLVAGCKNSVIPHTGDF